MNGRKANRHDELNASCESRIRLLVVDDHFFVRMGLTDSLNATPDMQVVAEAENGLQAIRSYRKHRPDLVILDGRLPGMGGVETLVALRLEFPDARVLISQWRSNKTKRLKRCLSLWKITAKPRGQVERLKPQI